MNETHTVGGTMMARSNGRGACAWLRGLALLACGALSPLALGSSLSVSSARADDVQDILVDLTPYDLEGTRSLDALEAFAKRAAEATDSRDREVLSFVHTLGAVDLWLAARVAGKADLEAKVAERYGVDTDSLGAVLTQSLRPLRESVYADTVADAATAVQWLSAHGDVPKGAQVTGTRTAVALLVAARERLQEGVSLESLAQLSADPCPRADICEEPFGRFDAEGRRALASMLAIDGAWRRMESARGRDPLVDAVAPHVDSVHTQLLAAELAPGMRMTSGPACPTAAGCGKRGSADVMAVVEPGAVRYGFVPRVKLAEDGSLQLLAAGAPIWPATQRIALPASYPPYLKPIKTVHTAFAGLLKESGDLSIAVAADSHTLAHVWARVMLSARVGGFSELSVLGRLANGETRMQPVKVVTAFAAPKLAPSELRVMILHKGYSVKRRGPTVSIDRVADDEGQLHFDLVRLAKQADADHTRDAQLRFMPDIAADALLFSAFAVAPTKDTLTMILP